MTNSILDVGLDALREANLATPVKRLIGHSGPVYACKFLAPEGVNLLLTCSQDKTARLWSLDTFSQVTCFKAHSLPIWDIDVAPLGCGPYFVTASADRTARLWSTLHPQPLRIFAGHLSDVEVVRFHPNGNYVVTGSSDRTIRMWDVQSGACVRLFTGLERPPSSLAISPNGRFLAVGDRGGSVRIYDLADGKLIRSIGGPKASSQVPGGINPMVTCYAMAWCQEGRMLAVSTADNQIRLIDMQRAAAATVSAPPSASSSSDPIASPDPVIASYVTKQTPIQHVRFSRRNVLIAAGAYSVDNL